MDTEKQLNRQYAAIHGSYWMYYGVICGFASVFLLERGYSNSEIGIILATGNILAVFVQPFIADFADRSKKLSFFSIMEMMTALLIVLTALLFVMQRKSLALMAVYVMAFAWMNIIQPFCNAMSFKLQESGIRINFGAARSMGSFTYATMCLFLGSLVEKYGANLLPITGELVLLLFLLTTVMIARTFKRTKEAREARGPKRGEVCKDADVDGGKTKGEIRCEREGEPKRPTGHEQGGEPEIDLIEFIRRNKMFFAVNLGVLGLYFTNSVLNSYMAQIAESVGGDSGDLGRIFALLAYMEIPTLIFFDRLRRRFSCQTMMKFSAVMFILWIGICHLARNVGMILAAQFIQPFSFALFLPSIVHFIDEIMSKGEAVKGQTLFTTMTTTAGIFASIVGGLILDASGAKALTLTATAVTVIGAGIIIATVDKVSVKK